MMMFTLVIFYNIFILENSQPIPCFDYRQLSTLMRPLNTHLAVYDIVPSIHTVPPVRALHPVSRA